MQYSWQNAFSIIGAVGGLCGLSSLWAARWQTQLVDQQMPSEETQDEDDLIRTI
jgi:hypothetical protein